MGSKKKTAKRYLKQNILYSLVAFIPVAMIVIALIPARTIQIGGTIIPRVDTSEKVVALTFDDGPQPVHTEELIKTLQKADVPATFFLIGLEMKRHPAEARKLINAGFDIGNHGYSHDSLVFKSYQTIAKEIETTDSLIRTAGYMGAIQFRPPYGHKFVMLPHYLASHDRPTITWDIAPDNNDSEQSVQSIVRNTVNNVHPGSIIVMHGMYDHNSPVRAALSQIIIELRSKNYRFVTVSELLNYR